jgi:hypothetical protein
MAEPQTPPPEDFPSMDPPPDTLEGETPLQIQTNEGVMPTALTGGNYDLRITEGENDKWVAHAITAPTTNLRRDNTVTVENPTPPTNVPVWWQGTPPTIYLAQAPSPPTTLYEKNAYVPAGPWATPAPNESAEGAFINAKDSYTTAGRPESFGAETSFVGPTSGWPAGAVATTMRGTGPETYSEFANQNHASSLSPANPTTLTSLNPTSTTSGVGQQTQTVTGTNFTAQSKIVVNGVTQVTTYISRTSLSAVVTKRTTAGTWPVVVNTGGALTAPQTWTFT